MASEKPLVSVNIPFYNGREFLAGAVNSALAQTYENLEIVIVNDGCDGPTPLEVLADAKIDCTRIKFVDHEKNLGLAAARNSAFEKSSGDLILPLDQDDLLEPSFLAETVPHLLAHGLDAVYTQIAIFGDREQIWSPDLSMLNIMCGLPCTSTILYRRNLFELVGGYNTRITTVVDSDFWLRLLSKQIKTARIDKPLFLYRKHADGMSKWSSDTEIQTLARNNEQLYRDNLFEVLSTTEKKYYQLKHEYAELEAGLKHVQSLHEDVTRKLQKRTVRYYLNKVVPFLDSGKS